MLFPSTYSEQKPCLKLRKMTKGLPNWQPLVGNRVKVIILCCNFINFLSTNFVLVINTVLTVWTIYVSDYKSYLNQKCHSKKEKSCQDFFLLSQGNPQKLLVKMLAKNKIHQIDFFHFVIQVVNDVDCYID